MEASPEHRAALKASAERIRYELNRAKKGGYYTDAWYFYIRKTDVERLVDALLGPDGEGR